MTKKVATENTAGTIKEVPAPKEVIFPKPNLCPILTSAIKVKMVSLHFPAAVFVRQI